MSAHVSRRDLLKRAAIFGASVPVVASLLAACGDDDDDDVVDDPVGVDPDDDDDDDTEDVEPDDDDDDDDDEPVADDRPGEGNYGGTLRAAINGEPPTFDIHQTSATQVTLVVMHIYEALFSWGSEFELIPELVDTWETSDDGLLNTLHLRQGVPFHDGNEMTAEDVTASIERWAEIVGFGQQLMAVTEEMRQVDDYTIEFEMSEQFGTFAVVLARQNNGCAIYPAHVIEAVGTSPIQEYIGTGPYQLVDHQPDRHIVLQRFEDYAYRDEEPNGYGGRKYAYLDEIRFLPVPDESARISGLQADDYDWLETITSDQFELLDNDPNVVAELDAPTGNTVLVPNMVEGPMANETLRRAVQARLDCDEILLAAAGDGFYRLNAGYMMEETVWYTDAGEELYNMADPDLAQELMEEAGYNGETIRILANTESEPNYNTGVMAQQQLEDIGMDVELLVFDWATSLETRDDMSAWDLFVTGFTMRVDPTQLANMRCEWAGQWCTPRKNELVDQLFRQVEFEDRFDTWEQIQALLYEEVACLKTGENLSVKAHTPRVQNLEQVQLAAAFYNVWLDE